MLRRKNYSVWSMLFQLNKMKKKLEFLEGKCKS